MRTSSLLLVLLIFSLGACDAAAPQASATAQPTGLTSTSDFATTATDQPKATAERQEPQVSTATPESSTISHSPEPDPNGAPILSPAFEGEHPAGDWRCWGLGGATSCPQSLRDVSFASSQDGWIVGDAGLILHWDGRQWNRVPGPSHLDLLQVAAVSAGEAWAQGIDPDQPHLASQLLRWDGSDWNYLGVPWDGDDGDLPGGVSPQQPTPASEITDWSFPAPGDGWVSVNYYGQQPFSQLYHWDGSKWDTAAETEPLSAVVMVNPREGWAGSLHGAIYRWDGARWNEFQPPEPGRAGVKFFQFLSPGEGWAVLDDGTLLRWDGMSWERSEKFDYSIEQLVFSSPNQGWLIPAAYPPALFRWNGADWQAYSGDNPPPPPDGLRLAALQNGEAWAVTAAYPPQVESSIWHWDGAHWRPYQPTSSLEMGQQLQALAFADLDQAWAVGDGGLIARWDGQGWLPDSSPTTYDLLDITFLSPDNGWAVGEGSQILHWDGRRWSVVRPYVPPNESSRQSYRLSGIAFLDEDTGWAVGDASAEHSDPLVLRWDGTTWTEVPWELLPENCECALKAVTVLDEQDAWAVGHGFDQAISLHWDGESWQKIPNPTGRSDGFIKDVAGVTPRDIWAAARTLLHWDGEAWSRHPGLGLNFDHLLFLAEEDGWATSSRDQAWHWNSQSWQPYPLPAFTAVADLAASPDGQVWLLTRDGLLLKFEREKEGNP